MKLHIKNIPLTLKKQKKKCRKIQLGKKHKFWKEKDSIQESSLSAGCTSTREKQSFFSLHVLVHVGCATYVPCTHSHMQIERERERHTHRYPHLSSALSLSLTQHTHSCCHFAPCSASLHYKLSLVLLPIKWHGNLGHFFPPSLSFSLSLCLSVSLSLSLLLPFFSPTPSYPFSHSHFPHHLSFVSRYSLCHKPFHLLLISSLVSLPAFTSPTI